MNVLLNTAYEHNLSPPVSNGVLIENKTKEWTIKILQIYFTALRTLKLVPILGYWRYASRIYSTNRTIVVISSTCG